MSPLLARLDALTTRAPGGRGRCLRCSRRILSRRYRIVIHREQGPVMLHERCAPRPLRLTARGRDVRDALLWGSAASAAIGVLISVGLAVGALR